MCSLNYWYVHSNGNGKERLLKASNGKRFMRKALYSAMSMVVWREQRLYNALHLKDGLVGVQVMSNRAHCF